MHSATIELPDGRQARLTMPDFFAMLMEVGEIPSPEVAAVLQLLNGSGALPRPDLITRLKADADHYARLYQLAALCLEWPRLVLMRRRCRDCGHTWDTLSRQCTACLSDASDRDDRRTADELAPRDLPFLIIQDIYTDFFLGTAARIRPAAPAKDTRGPERAAPAGDDVSPVAEPVSADSGSAQSVQPG